MEKRLLYILPVLVLGSFALLVKDFRHFGLMWHFDRLGFSALALMLLLLGLVILYTRKKFGNPGLYVTELALVGLCLLPVSLLIVTRLNGIKTERVEIPFTFNAERARISAPFGLLQGEKRDLHWKLAATTSDGSTANFTYQGIARFPLTQPGETIVLPMECGLLGACKLILPE